MQKYLKLALVLIAMNCGTCVSFAQTTILDQTLLTQASFNTFTPVSVTGAQTWTFNASYGATCNGFASGQSVANEDWFVSAAVNLSQMNNVKLTFSHTRGSASVVNVGVAQGWYKVYATANYTGNPSTTQWTELTGLNQTVTTAWQYVPSGELTIPDAAKSQTSRIAFRYMSSATQSATWEVKNVKITGEPQGTSGLKVTNWNVEWLGCTLNGPTDETLQLNNVIAALQSMNADVYCLQEISNTTASPTMASIVSALGSSQWAGQLVPSTTDNCDQRQAIIYKKAKVQFVSAAQLSTGNAAQGNSYYYNWSSGRYPAVYNINVVSGSNLVPVTIVNIHAKAEDGDATSYTRRLGASQALKPILDASGYNSKNLILVGDFNDYLVGTSSATCNCSISPYKNFIDDTANYDGITKAIVDNNTSFGTHPIIENFIISNELFANYVAGSVAQEVSVAQSTSDYYNTTSDHLPVSARFQFSTLGNPDFAQVQNRNWTVYPNPVKDKLQFDTTGLENETAAVYDLTGRQMRCEKIDANTIGVNGLPVGVYVLRVGNRNARFVKQ